jgi:hypothetical protein
MTTMNDLFPSPYLTAHDVAHKPTVTIKSFSKKSMKNKQGEEEVKPIIFFNEFEKGMVLNKTNANTIAGLYGSTLENWIGERVMLHSVMVEAFGESQEAIRVMNSKPSADKATLIERYQKLFERGKKANMDGIDNYVISPDMPTDDIIAVGKELKVKVEAAESF